MACDSSSTDPECGPGNGPHCYDHDPACCHCGKPRPECEHPNKLYTGSVYNGPAGRKTFLFYTCPDCKVNLKEEELDGFERPESSTECEGGCRIYSAPPCRDPAKCSCGGEWWKHGCKHSLPPEPRCAGCGDQHGPEEHERRCPGCGHSEHSGVCLELEMPGPPGDVDECGCLDDREPPLTPEEEEEASQDMPCTCSSRTENEDGVVIHDEDCDALLTPYHGEHGYPPKDALRPPEGPEYTPCVCGHIEPEHEVDGYCYDEKCGCVGYRTKPDFELPPQPDRRPPYLLAYSVQGHLYEVALPGDATVAALDGRLVITHSLGPVAGICQIAPITSEESTR